MTRYEYKVLPAPVKGLKVRGAKTSEARFAHALMEIMNAQGAEGWDYVRSDTLPCEERVGLTGRTTKFQNMLVFRRPLPEAQDERRLPEGQPSAARAAANVAATPIQRGVEIHGISAGRLAATLSARPPEGSSPLLRATTEPGVAPRLGAAEQTQPGQGNGAAT